MVDKNLFLHDLAIVAILKNEGHYLKEWLDYHLLAGVGHFYLYDNDSTDNQAEVAKPYVDAGLVDYFRAPGKLMQHYAYNDAVKRFKFQCRYMAFIDGDEFIYPKSERSIPEVIDEIFAFDKHVAGAAINWQIFGSNGQETADYSRGVLERFTRRAPKDWSGEVPGGYIGGNIHVKMISNPRKISFINHSHYQSYFESFYAVNENGDIVVGYDNEPVTAEKIVINHYYAKSREEYAIKKQRGKADVLGNYVDEGFTAYDRNEEFDDGILHYRDERLKTYQPPDKSNVNERLLNALAENLLPTFLTSTPPEFFAGKMETFLTCRAVAAYLKETMPDNSRAKLFEEASIRAIIKAFDRMNFVDGRLLINELPEILPLDYPAVKDLRKGVVRVISKMQEVLHANVKWQEYIQLDYLQRLIKNLGE